MKILIVSDTHRKDGNLYDVIEKEKPFDMLIHCGDVEGREIFIEAFTECPCHIVSGNNDFFSDLPREEIIEVGNAAVKENIHKGQPGICEPHRAYVLCSIQALECL